MVIFLFVIKGLLKDIIQYIMKKVEIFIDPSKKQKIMEKKCIINDNEDDVII